MSDEDASRKRRKTSDPEEVKAVDPAGAASGGTKNTGAAVETSDPEVVDLTSSGNDDPKAKAKFTIHDVVDLTAPSPARPASGKGKKKGFELKTFGDCDIISCDTDKIFDDDIVIVTSEAFKAHEAAKKKKKEAPKDQPPQTTVVSNKGGPSNVARAAPSSWPPPDVQAKIDNTRNLLAANGFPSVAGQVPPPPAVAAAPPPAPPPAPPLPLPRASRSQHPALPLFPPPPPLPLGPNPSRRAKKAHAKAMKDAIQMRRDFARASTTQSSSLYNSLVGNQPGPSHQGAPPINDPQIIDNRPGHSNSSQRAQYYVSIPSSSSSFSTPQASAATAPTGSGTVTLSNSTPGTLPTTITTNHIYCYRSQNRLRYQCPCHRCKGNQWYLTFETVRGHMRSHGVINDWLPADNSLATNTSCGLLAQVKGAAAGAPRYVPPARPTPQQPPRHDPSTMNTAQNTPVADNSSPSLDGIPVVPPGVPDEPGALSCPVCLDSKVQIKASGRNVVSTFCGHIFCSFCIEQVFKINKTCPQCRKKLKYGNWHPIYI